MSSHRNAHRLALLAEAKDLGIQGRHKMNSSTLRTRIQEERQKRAVPTPALVVARCSACGSDAEHHVNYVLEHGLCVV